MSSARYFIVEPSWPIDCCGDVLTVESLTDDRYLPFTQSWEERSRMARHWWILWGMQPAGETLSVGRSLSLIVLFFMTISKPFWILVCASECRAVLAYIDLDDMYGPWRISASIFSVDHAGIQFTGQPSVDNNCRRGFTRWWVAYVRGHMSPSLPIL